MGEMVRTLHNMLRCYQELFMQAPGKSQLEDLFRLDEIPFEFVWERETIRLSREQLQLSFADMEALHPPLAGNSRLLMQWRIRVKLNRAAPADCLAAHLLARPPYHAVLKLGGIHQYVNCLRQPLPPHTQLALAEFLGSIDVERDEIAQMQLRNSTRGLV
jgi:hypothetical protein